MGITVHYRGTLADLSRVEDFEDRVIDLALAVGGNPRLWRSANEDDPTRMVRGLIIDLAPGQETASLLVSPEGWLIGLFQIEEAERGVLSEKPWCWVKTQFGPIEGHVTLVELLTGLTKEFIPDLEVMDESGYWDHRDVSVLRQKIEFLGQAIDMLAGELDKDRLSPEAREDPEILATRIERLARKVHQTLSRPAEHPPVHFPDDETGAPPDPIENEARWDALFAENRRKQERMERVVEEQMLRGEDTRDALEAAMNEVVPQLDWIADDGGEGDTPEAFAADSNFDEPPVEDESWRESFPEALLNDDHEEPFAAMQRHPLQQQATNLLTEFFDLAKRTKSSSSNIETLMRNALEVTGGLAQVLPLPPYEADESKTGLALVQLKRALRGAAFVRGTLYLLRTDQLVDDAEFRRFMSEADAISNQLIDLLRSVREAQA
jgi:hypothetical protein